MQSLYYRARYYDYANGRLVSEDPALFGGQDINLFRYVRNRPSAANDPTGLIAVDPNFRPDCLSSLARALTLVRMIALKNHGCNCAFATGPKHQTLMQLLDDPSIPLISLPKDEKIEVSPGTQVWEAANTTLPAPGAKGRPGPIAIRPITCRRGRWAIARSLIHELTHYSLYPAPDAYGETLEYGRENDCGIPEQITTTITVRPE